MSTPSTPRSTRSTRPTHSPAIWTDVITPNRKIKAMLAALDCDSEPEKTTSPTRSPAIWKSAFAISRSNKTASVDEHEDADEDEDAIVFAPRGRMAARMQGLDNEKESESTSVPQPETAYERVARTLRAPSADASSTDATPTEPTEAPVTNENQSSDDDLPFATSSRRRRVQQKSHVSNSIFEEIGGTQRSGRSESPLFVDQDDNANDTQIDRARNERLRALIQQKREERKERERIEADEKAARLRAEKAEQFHSDILANEDSEGDVGSARKMTQQSRPARKASKKALEEMQRETQRMARNMQLTHEARTKRKITKESFIANFNFGQQPAQTTNGTTTSSTSASSATSSDGERYKEKGTPPTSPVEANFDEQPDKDKNLADDPLELPSVEELKTQVMASAAEPTAVQTTVLSNSAARPKKQMKPINIRLSRKDVSRYQQEGSDDELEVITSPGKCRRYAMFENIRSKHSPESKSNLHLKLLARLSSPTRRSKSMTPAELSIALRLKARQQALQDRQERIEELRARGIVIETAEEREAMEAEVENLVEKARQEADEIARREKAARGKKSGVESDSDDEEFELSGSEDDEDENDEDEDDEDDEGEESEEDSHPKLGDLVENEADSTAESEDEELEIEPQDDDQDTVVQGTRRRRPMRVVSDDEDEEEEAKDTKPRSAPLQAIQTPARSIAASSNSAQRPHFPGMSETSSFAMSLTQAFAGTIAESQPDMVEDSFDGIQSLPDPGLSKFQGMMIDSQVMVKDSQEQRRESIDLLADYTQSNARVSESPAPNWSQPSQFPEPTQDAGFVLTPLDHSKRFLDIPASTIDTVILPEREVESPTIKRGRLHQRRRPVQLSDDEDGDFEVKASAFDVMKKASKTKTKSAVPFDKINSKAKDHIDEAAEESEDEYAGLGGASDDENEDEDEIDRQMINDNSGEVVDEKELAALNANHQRAMDEKQVSKLLKDITTGALRRRRGADDDFDLDDSDDERLARQRAKQREFAKMRKALLADEKVNEIANNPKKSAFFTALEDRDNDDEMDFEFENGADLPDEASQDVAGQKETMSGGIDSGNSSNKRKRPLEPAAEDATNRPPPHLRRTAASASRKPSSLAEIRETLSFLTETPEYDSFREDASVDEEIVYDTDKGASENESTQEKRMSEGFAIPQNPRRTRGHVVDRLALKRAASSNSASANTKAAFMTGSDVFPQIGFRPPSLLRRSTTSSSSASSDTTVSTTRTSNNKKQSTNGGGRPAASTTKGAVNYYTAARERERERELRIRDGGGRSAATMALLKKKALSSSLMALNKNQWE